MGKVGTSRSDPEELVSTVSSLKKKFIAKPRWSRTSTIVWVLRHLHGRRKSSVGSIIRAQIEEFTGRPVQPILKTSEPT